MIDKLRRIFLPNSLRAHLLALVIAALAPLLIFAAAMVVLSARKEQEVFERGAIERTRALITAVDAEIQSSISTLEALATSNWLDHEDMKEFYEEAARVLRSQPSWRTIIVSYPSGESIMNLRQPFGAKLNDIVERRSFDDAVKKMKPAIGNVLLAPNLKEYGFAVRVPVIRDANVRYVLSAGIDLKTIDNLLAPQKLPANWIGVVLDTEGKFVSRSIEPERNVGRLASESLRAALDRSSEGWFRGTTIEGWEVYTAYSRSEFSGWTVALGIPADVVEGNLRRSVTYLVLFGSGLLVFGLMVAWILAQRTVASIESLSLIAKEASAGKRPMSLPPAPASPSSKIAEVETVRAALVSAHRLLDEQAEEKEQLMVRLQLALAAGDIGVHEWYPDTNRLIWDDRVRAHWGLPPGAPVDFETFRSAIHREDGSKLEAALKRALDPASGGHYQAEFRVIGIEDHVERWIDARGQVLFENGKAARLTGTTLDITARKAFQAELERQVQERTARLEETVGELEAFSYSVSHDLRAPLRAMEGYAKALATDYRDRLDAQGQQWLDRVSRSAHRLDTLIKDVLAYSRVSKREVELSPLDLAPIIEDIVSGNPDFQPPAARVRIDKPMHRVLGHEAYLTQCVTNLLGNAVKFVAPGVVPEIRIRSERLNDRVRIWFEDNGIGIDPSHHERIFQIFGQVYPESRYAGTGIGLAIVRKAVQRMNGEIGVISELGKGSRFWLLLEGAKA